MTNNLKKLMLAAAWAAALAAVAPAHAANWLMLQGTEAPDAAPRINVWGFIQAVYEKDTSDPNPFVGTPGNNFEYVPPKLLGPDLKSQEGFNVNRARLGARGAGLPLDSKVNYFLLAEFGNNGITRGGGGSAKLTDASITLNHIQGARVRVGAFKTPGFEEGLQAIHVMDYINFTEVANQLMLERFPNDRPTLNRNNRAGFNFTDDGSISPYNLFDKPVGAFRDVGIQVFDAFRRGDWEHSYAAMVGNGHGVNFSDNDDNKDLYLYLSTERIYGGEGPRRQGLKFFVWAQDGKRTLYNPATPAPNDPEPAGKTEYDRERSGLGVKYLRGAYRVTAEYLQGKGMIFVGPDNPSFTITAPCAEAAPPGPVTTCASDANRPLLADGRKGEADGWYIEGGWYIPDSNWELDLRYDVYNRLTDAVQLAGPCAFEYKFETWTLGAQYHLNLRTRVTMNAAMRDFEAVHCPAPAPGGNPNNNLDGVDTRYSVQLTHIF